MKNILAIMVILVLVFSAATNSYTTSGPSYGNLYEDGGSTNITITTAGTYYQWATSTAGSSFNTTLSTSSDNITIDAGGAGIYLATVNVSASCVGSSAEAKVAIFVNGSRQVNVTNYARIENLGAEPLSACGIITLAVGDVVDIRFTSGTNGDVVIPTNVNFTLNRIRKI